MPAHSHHIVKSYDAELNRLTGEIVRMGELARAQLKAAIAAVASREDADAHPVPPADVEIDRLEKEVSHDVVQLLVARAPMARDLREVVASLRIAADIERIGDYAANIAKRALVLNESAQVRPVKVLPRLAQVADILLEEALASYRDRDADRALRVWGEDEQLDALYTGLFRELLTYMMEDPRTITPCTHLLFMAKNVERIGDHCTNIAENVYYIVHGEEIPTDRRKADNSASINPGPPTG